MGYSDNKMILATLTLCMLLPGTAFDVVMAQEDNYLNFYGDGGDAGVAATGLSDQLNRVSQGMPPPATPTGGAVPRALAQAPADQAAYIEPHNKARAEVGLGPLTWNETLANYAQNYANQRAADCALEHSDTKGAYGENIAQSGADPLPGEVVKWWVDEEKPFYDPGTKQCKPGGGCGHYMQVINPNTNTLGCAKVQCTGGKGYFAICNYNW